MSSDLNRKCFHHRINRQTSTARQGLPQGSPRRPVPRSPYLDEGFRHPVAMKRNIPQYEPEMRPTVKTSWADDGPSSWNSSKLEPVPKAVGFEHKQVKCNHSVLKLKQKAAKLVKKIAKLDANLELKSVEPKPQRAKHLRRLLTPKPKSSKPAPQSVDFEMRPVPKPVAVKAVKPAANEAEPPDGEVIPSVEPQPDGHYELSPLMTRMLENELQRIMIKMWQVLPDEPPSGAEKSVANKFRNEAGDDIRNVLGLNVTKRLLNIHNTLYVKLTFSRKPDAFHLKQLLRDYSCVGIRRAGGGPARAGYAFLVEMNSVVDFDRICKEKVVRCGVARANVGPCYDFRKCPSKLKSIYNEATSKANDDTTQGDKTSEKRNKTTEFSSLEKKTSSTLDKKASDILEKKKAQVPEKKVTEIPEKKTAQVPEKKVSETPEKKTAQVPEKKVSETPEKKTAQVPEKKVSETPEKRIAQVPEKKNSEIPEKKAAKVTKSENKVGASASLVKKAEIRPLETKPAEGTQPKKAGTLSSGKESAVGSQPKKVEIAPSETKPIQGAQLEKAKTSSSEKKPMGDAQPKKMVTSSSVTKPAVDASLKKTTETDSIEKKTEILLEQKKLEISSSATKLAVGKKAIETTQTVSLEKKTEIPVSQKNSEIPSATKPAVGALRKTTEKPETVSLEKKTEIALTKKPATDFPPKAKTIENTVNKTGQQNQTIIAANKNVTGNIENTTEVKNVKTVSGKAPVNTAKSEEIKNATDNTPKALKQNITKTVVTPKANPKSVPKQDSGKINVIKGSNVNKSKPVIKNVKSINAAKKMVDPKVTPTKNKLKDMIIIDENTYDDEFDENDELNDDDILALMSGAIVLDECSGSGED